MKVDFPLRGIIGIVARSAAEVQAAIDAGLSCIEIRADLLHDAGLDRAAVEGIVRDAKDAGLQTLYTLRHPDHGGTFRGSESDRAELTLAALAAGATLADLEWRSEASRIVLEAGARLILSHHDFSAMPDETELVAWTESMEAHHPAAIKVVPTADSVDDAVRMLNWVAQARDCPRIGFAMGGAGACSRILCIAFGAPITYAAFGPAVAPGQLSIAALRDTCGVDRLDASTRVIAIAGATLADESALHALRAAHEYRPPAHTFVPVPINDKAELIRNVEALRIDAVAMDDVCGGDGTTFIPAAELVA
jgi:3-dehydroquinate dehydratase-1